MLDRTAKELGMQEQEGLPVERITRAQFAQAMVGQEVQGVPTGEIAYPVLKPQDKVVDKPGEDLAKHRVRVSFEFDVTCNSGPVAKLSYDEGGTMSMALLKSFLVANRGKLLDMMVDAIGQKLGMHSCETFMLEFLPQVNIESKELFNAAIEKLEGDEKQYWREVRDEPANRTWGDYITVCTEELFKCFDAEFVGSSYGIVEDRTT